MTRSIRCALIAAAVSHGTFALISTSADAASKTARKQPDAAAAQGAEPAASAEQQAARRGYEGGVKAFGAGKYQNAVDQLNVALRGGGLGTPEMAKGLYIRGASYRKLGKPGLAISDLTSALWLKNGLSDADRKSATAERAEAYKAAGVADAGPAPEARNDTPAAPAASAPSAVATAPAQVPTTSAIATAPAASAPVQTAASSAAESVPQPLSLGGESASAPPPRYARTDDKVTSGGAINQAAAPEQPYVSSPAAPSAAPVPAAAQPVLSAVPMDQAAAPVSTTTSAGGVGSAISGFFSNVFGGSTSPTQAPAAVQTASTGPASAPPVSPQTSSWDSASITKGSSNKVAKVDVQPAGKQAAAVPAAAPAPAKVKGGKYKLHIAAMRSRAEADALAQKLNAEHASAFASRTAAVDEAVIGSMGTFYRVRVGSYATADEPRGLCNALRNSGYDCLVVTK